MSNLITNPLIVAIYVNSKQFFITFSDNGKINSFKIGPDGNGPREVWQELYYVNTKLWVGGNK